MIIQRQDLLEKYRRLKILTNRIAKLQGTEGYYENKYTFDTFINVKKDTVLVRALMELIISDENIPTEQEFNIGWIVLKQELRNTTDVSLPSFILGIWYYLLIHIDDNKIGSETYEKWCPRNNQGKREYQGTLGEDSTLEITVTRPAITHISRTEKAAISDTNENKQSEISLPVPHEVPPEALEDIPYNADDIELLREFNTDYDAIIMKCIGDNFAMFWLEGQLSVQIRTLFEGKWKERSSLFYDLSLHSNILAMLDYLQKLCDILDPNTNNHDITAFKPSVREIRRKMRNCYIKLHPYEYIGRFPYETGIADWMEGE